MGTRLLSSPLVPPMPKLNNLGRDQTSATSHTLASVLLGKAERKASQCYQEKRSTEGQKGFRSVPVWS